MRTLNPTGVEARELNPYTILVKDFRGIKLKVSRRTCGPERIDEGGMLPRNFAPDSTIRPYQLGQFAKRLLSG